jgi:hypothetical protein
VLRVMRTRVRRIPNVMNRLEARYAQQLDAQRRVGEVLWFGYEAITLKLAPDTRYTPDFAVITCEGEMQFHETKGHWRDDALVKIKVAANLFPWAEFRAINSKGEVRVFAPGEMPR